MDKILAIDYGNVRVGLAVSDDLGITAQGLDTLVINNSNKKFLNEIENIVKKMNIKSIVIGYPKNMNGTISEKAKLIDELIPKIESRTSIKVIRWDERLTTVLAYKTMRQLNISQKKKNSVADKLAATYILESYLQSIENQKY